MSIWGTLGKIGLGIAAPFTGGASLAGIPLIDGISRVAGGISAGRGAGRQAEGQANNSYDMDRLNMANFNLNAPGHRASNSVRGDMLAGLQPMTVNGPITGTHGNIPQISGGISPALLSQNSRQLGQSMSRDALLSQMQGPMQPTAQPQSSWMDTLLNGVGYAGAAAGAISQGLNQPKPRPQIPQVPTGGNGIPGLPMYQEPDRRWY